MLKLIRFLMYGGIVLFVLIAKSRAIWTCIDVLKSQNYFFEDGKYILIHGIFLSISFVYFFWLLGSTFNQWRMPLWSHVIPFLLLSWVLWTNGWIFRTSAGFGDRSRPEMIASPALRAMGAMETVQKFLTTHPCQSTDSKILLDALGDRQWTGYRSFGMAQRYRIVQSQGVEPIVTIPQDVREPGIIFVVCNAEDNSFALSSLVTAATPRGPLSFVVDGVGRPVTLIGRLRR